MKLLIFCNSSIITDGLTIKSFKRCIDFVKNKNYKIGKLCSNEIQIISSWHFELEKFYETNFVIINEKFVKNKFCYNVKFNRFNVLIYE